MSWFSAAEPLLHCSSPTREPDHHEQQIDVDAIAEITSYAGYATFGERPRALGFTEDAREGAPLCRWVQKTTILDVMPLDEKVLGFSNRWYSEAMETATRHGIALILKCEW